MAEFQLAIIGGGPAGLTAGIYAGRAELKTVLLERLSPGGQVLTTDWIENYPGFPEGISGFDLIDKMTAQMRKFSTEEKGLEITSIEQVDKKEFLLHSSSGETVSSTAVIISTGAAPNKLGVPGEEEFIGKGVSYCATCDGPFFKDQVVAVIGGGDSAVQEALFLTKIVKKVYLIHRRDKLRAVKWLQERAFANPKIEFIWDTILEKIEGKDGVESIQLLNKKTGQTTHLPVQGVFIFIGTHPNTAFLPDFIKKEPRGFILTDEWMQTSQQGIYAAGDCRAKPLRQIVSAVSEGATAVYGVEHYISELGI